MTQWLFNQGAVPTDDCGLPSQAIVDGTLGGGIVKYTTAVEEMVVAVNDALDCCQAAVCPPKARGNSTGTGARARAAEGPCTLMDVPAAWNPSAFWSLHVNQNPDDCSVMP